MSPTDWDSDPELKALRDDFIASFAERRRLLEQVISELEGPGADAPPSAVESLRLISHKLAGVAESYGFSLLSEASGALEDFLERVSEKERLLRYSRLLTRMLESADRERKDPEAFRADAVFKELICAAE